MEALFAIEEALVGLAPEDRTTASAPVLVDLVFDALAMDEDDINAASRRGLLLAAVGGNPLASCVLGSPAALETAADLAEDGYDVTLAAALAGLADAVPATCPCVAAAVADLRADGAAALDALAVVVLHRAMD